MLSTRCLTLGLIIIIGVTIALCENSASVYRIVPRTNEQLHVLRKLDRKLQDISYWSDPRGLNETVDLLVPGEQNGQFEHLMNENRLDYEVYIADVQQLLNNSVASPKKSSIKKRYYLRNDAQNQFDLAKFHTLDEIYNWLDSLATLYPNSVSVVVAGRSTQNRLIKGVRLSFGQGKQGVFIEAGIHAREWLSHSTAIYVINELLTSASPEVRQLAESYEWHIFPCVNPDGYAYTQMNPTHLTNRMWRKTRSKQTMQQCNGYYCRNTDCYGVDPNRNWDFYWGTTGSNTLNPCSEIYAGTSAFSEMETKSLASYIDKIGRNLFAYISFHSYTQKLIFPYGHTKNHLDNYDEQYAVALDTVNALAKRYGTVYGVGSIGEVMGEASGSSIDWVKANYRVPFVYCYELRGKTSQNQRYGFIAPPSEIVPIGEEIMDSLVALFQSATRWRRNRRKL